MIDLVVDVGANTGQYARQLRWFGYQGPIISFEPMRVAFAELAEAAAADRAWTAIATALGDATEEQTINVAGNSISSSLLPMLDRHVATAPKSRYVGTETIKVERLDASPARGPVLAAAHPYLKIDTQGYEDTVLRGAGELLDRFAGVELELSLVPLYGGQPLLLQMVQQMEECGFRLVHLSDGLIEERTGETLQVDGIFVRKES